MARKNKREKIERGLYRADRVYWACATPHGERQARWKKLGDVGIQEARRLRDDFAYEVRTGRVPATARRRTVAAVVGEWFAQLDELERAEELRPRTVASYKDGINLHLTPMWGGRDIRSITADDLVVWHERQRATGAANWSIRARWIAVRGLFNYAVRASYVAANPCDALIKRERPKPGRAKARYLSEAEISALLEKADEAATVIIALLVFSGLRVSELLGLVWSDIDFKAQQIHVACQMSRNGARTRLKTEAGKRNVILMDALAHMLREHKLAARFSAADDLVIPNGVGKTLGYSRLRKAFAGAAEAANIVSVTPHTCRHTFASILIDQGRSVEFVSDQLGHASTKTTWDIYVHLFRAREQAAAAREGLDAAFGPMLRTIGDSTAPDANRA